MLVFSSCMLWGSLSLCCWYHCLTELSLILNMYTYLYICLTRSNAGNPNFHRSVSVLITSAEKMSGLKPNLTWIWVEDSRAGRSLAGRRGVWGAGALCSAPSFQTSATWVGNCILSWRFQLQKEVVPSNLCQQIPGGLPYLSTGGCSRAPLSPHHQKQANSHPGCAFEERASSKKGNKATKPHSNGFLQLEVHPGRCSGLDQCQLQL